MRKLGLSLAFLLGATAPLAAQQQWQPEIGLRAGFTKFDVPNSSGDLSIIDFPFGGGYSGTVNPSALYGIIPLRGRFALQPSFGFYNISASGTTITTASPGIRLNVAIADGFYGGVGATAYILKQDGFEATQGGYEAAIGYRRPVGSRLHGSAEFFYEKREQDNALLKLNAYGVRIGMGYAISGEGAARRATGRPMSESRPMWKKAIAVQGGWSLVSFPNATDLTTFSLPFSGQTPLAGTIAVPGPSGLSMLFPVGEKFALEPSVDFHRYSPSGSDASTFWQLGGRVNYAFNHAAYAAAGLEFSGFSVTGASDKSRVTELLAAGFRFPITGALMGRTEFDYRTFDGNDILPSGQATSFVFGLMMPLN